ncbi:MAG: hypothetical protein EZS28_031587, partial [Streblomastix strix]
MDKQIGPVTAVPSEKIRLQQEQEKILQMQKEIEEVVKDDQPAPATEESKEDIDRRSIYVGSVDFQTTPEELHELFKRFGLIRRVTILQNKQGTPKCIAYIEFVDESSV